MKYLIVANGPFLETALIKTAAQSACIIALDGAAGSSSSSTYGSIKK